MVNIITATNIPDDIPLLLKYSYRITSNVPDKIGVNEVTFSHQFWNTAKLEGMDQESSSISSKAEWKYASSTAGVVTDRNYSFYKVESGN